MRISFVVATAAALLAGCSSYMPNSLGNLWPWSSRPAANAAAGERYVVTLPSRNDPKAGATQYCGQLDRQAQLSSAVRNPAADPANDTITWTFDCIY